ncbi:unnamed protein product, partial [marine sediment metagenome]
FALNSWERKRLAELLKTPACNNQWFQKIKEIKQKQKEKEKKL